MKRQPTKTPRALKGTVRTSNRTFYFFTWARTNLEVSAEALANLYPRAETTMVETELTEAEVIANNAAELDGTYID